MIAALRAAGVREPARRVGRVTGAFMWLGVTESVAYPLMLGFSNIVSPAAVPVMYLYVARLVDSGANVGFDYYTYAILGFVATVSLAGSLTAFSGAVDAAIQQGRFETYLVQPVGWYALPFALAAWPIVLGFVNAAVMIGLGLLLGVDIHVSKLPLAILVLVLGVASAHAIGTLAASVRLLSKKADPVVTIYNLAAAVFSGALFPIDLLPWFIKPVAFLLPHTYVLSVMRRLLMPEGAGISGPSITVSLTVLALGTVALYGICLYAFGRSLDFGRRYGVLGGY